MNDARASWNDFYRNNPCINSDNWLEKYNAFYSPDGYYLDLGCGSGCNLEYLTSKSPNIFACDYSAEAVKKVKTVYRINAVVADIRNRLPYKYNLFDYIVADLSLHYFSESDTRKIIEELIMILKRPGFIFARVNSINDVNHGAKKGIEIEHNYFDMNGRLKRFFDRKMIDKFFKNDFEIINILETNTGKYREKKVLWEIARKIPD